MRYVAIGDSFTEGVGDELPDGSVRGWADRVAMGLAAGSGETIDYANLAIRGRLLEPILAEQLDAALSLSPRPTLISLNGGGNDMMRPGSDMEHLIQLTEQAVQRCAAAGVSLLLLSGPDPSSRLPFGSLIRRRGLRLTEGVAELAAKYDLVFVNMFVDPEVRNPGYWSPDRLHLNGRGHQRVAAFVLTALGYPVVPTDGIDADPSAKRGPMSEFNYYRQHVLPWIGRRIHGRSSGDGRTAKCSDWTPVPAA